MVAGYAEDCAGKVFNGLRLLTTKVLNDDADDDAEDGEKDDGEMLTQRDTTSTA